MLRIRKVNYETLVLKSSLPDYSHGYVLVKGTISVVIFAAADADV